MLLASRVSAESELVASMTSRSHGANPGKAGKS